MLCGVFGQAQNGALVCAGCQGPRLLALVDNVANLLNCLNRIGVIGFIPGLSTTLVPIITQLEALHRGTFSVVPITCQSRVTYISCGGNWQCISNYLGVLARSYNTMEQCAGIVPNPGLLESILLILNGLIRTISGLAFTFLCRIGW